MKLASVIGVTLDDKSNDTVGSIIAIEKGGTSGQLRCFPLNTNNYKNNNNLKLYKKKNSISTELILSNPNLIPLYEKIYNI